MSEDRTAELNTRDGLLELAERYETVAALDLTPAQQALVGTVVPRELRLIAGGTP